MKKTFLTIAIILGVTFCAMAQPQGGGLFQRGFVSDEAAANEGARGGLINLPGSHGSTNDADGPLGGGIALLTGLGAAYLVAKKRKNTQRGAMMALLALLAFGPTASAQNFNVWDGVTKTKPEEYLGRIVIRTAAELAYIRDNYDEEEWDEHVVYSHLGSYVERKEPYKMPISLEADIDMGDKVSWIPLGWTGSSMDYYESTFYGNGHTIRINIDGATDNYQGLFSGIHSDGKVYDLHVTGNIHCTESRLVGGIAGENDGTIENCWVTANVSSDWQDSGVAVTGKVGGIAGENNGTIQFCCMAGDVTNNDADVGGLVGNNDGILSHCTFYGTRNSSHSQDSKYVGDSGTEEDLYDTFQSSELGVGGDCYHYAIKYPWRVTVNTEGNGTIQTYAAGENDVPGTRAGETFTLRVTSGTAISCTVTDADGTALLWDTQATDETSFWFTMPNKNVTATIVFDYTDWPTQGAGTEDDPYIISSAADWNDFAHNVNLGRSYSGKYVKLTSDISVTKSAGGYQTDDNCQPFSGTFDGDGHTLTINLNNQSRFAAPFKCVSGATIKNLRTAGTIDGTGNADGKLLAGIIGVSFGNTTITRCRSSVTLTTNFGDDAALAGLVAGTKGGSLTIEGCVFDGSMTGASNTRCAGIAGYEYTATTTTISDCLFIPATLTISTADDGYTKTISRDADATITNCYYTQTLGAAQGTVAVASTTVLSELGSLVQDYGWVKVFQNGLLSGGKSYVTPGTNSTCTGTAQDPYIISNNDQWTILAAYVNGGNNFSGKVFSLVADIDISTPVGLYDPNFNTYIFNSFNGTFLGNGHTITAALNNDDYQGLAPFRYIYGATIKDLKVAGTIASSQYHSAGVVGFASGANTIEGCVVTATLNINSDHAGGIIGHGLNSNTTIQGCVFAGTINGVDGNRENIGGIWGWSNSGTPTLENCLEAGTYTNIASMHPMGLQSNRGNITNCYYLNPQVGSPQNACTVSGAKQAYVFTTAHDDLGELVKDYGTIKVYQNGILYNGIYYVALPGSISLTVQGYGNSTESDHWAFIASPVAESIGATTVGNIFSATEYDLYRFNPSADLEWENWKQEGNHHHFNLENGQGYLYATKETKTLGFSGTFNEDDEMTIANLSQGFNLVGNPFTTDAYINKPYYTLNEDGSVIVAQPNGTTTPIAPCHGVIVEVNGNESVTFSKTAPAATANQGLLNITVAEQKSGTRGASTGSATAIDNAIVRFGEGEQLGKFHFGNPSANISIPQGGKEYAVANVNVGTDVARNVSTNEIPVNFKASKNGEYTLSVNPENVEFDYLHLIDNLTGSDVDLLALRQAQGPASYTFTAKTTDYASRFRLVFSASGDACEPSGNFAFISNGNIIVNGEGTLQVIDMMGRVTVCRDASHASAISTSGMTPGMYVLRLIKGETVRTQKIVIE